MKKIKNIRSKILFLVAILFLPIVIFAVPTETPTINSTLLEFTDVLELVKNIIFALAFLGFFWGLLQFIFGSEDTRDAGRSKMIWGIIVLVVMFSIWGILGLIQNTFTGLHIMGSGRIPVLPEAV